MTWKIFKCPVCGHEIKLYSFREGYRICPGCDKLLLEKENKKALVYRTGLGFKK